MKGIILAGGTGSRLYPLTLGVSKQLLGVYDKPMIYYPLSVLLLADIKEILIISTPTDIELYKKLLGDGSNLGIKFEYIIQDKPRGLAEAFILGESFIGNDNVCLILGDNIFYGDSIRKLLIENKNYVSEGKAVIHGYYVNNPREYGVVNLNEKGEIIEIEEKPQKPKSNYAVTGLYFYPNSVIKIAKNVKPSERGELEITSINNEYLRLNKIKLSKFGRGYAWLDTGTHESLIEASNFIYAIEKRQGLKIACIEEIAYNLGYISKEHLRKIASKLGNSEYGRYLKNYTNL